MKQLVAILVVAVAGLGASAAFLYQQLGAERSANAELRDRIMSLEVTQQAALAAPAVQPPAPAVAIATPAAEAAPPAPQAPAPSASGLAATLSASAADLMNRMTDPTTRDVRIGQRRTMLPMLYPEMGKWLELTRDEESRLLDLLARQEIELSDITLNPANRNNPEAQQQAARESAARQQAHDADVAALLGDKYPQFQEYKQARGVYQQVSQLQGMLGSSTDGLPDAQAKSLASALAAEQRRISQERLNVAPPTPANAQDFINQRVQQQRETSRRLLQVAAAQLNPQQLASYQQLVQQQERTTETLSRALGEAEAAAAAARPATGR